MGQLRDLWAGLWPPMSFGSFSKAWHWLSIARIEETQSPAELSFLPPEENSHWPWQGLDGPHLECLQACWPVALHHEAPTHAFLSSLVTFTQTAWAWLLEGLKLNEWTSRFAEAKAQRGTLSSRVLEDHLQR